MSDSVTILLPPSVDAVVKGFSNASFLQRITVLRPGADPLYLEGKGEANALIGRAYFTTPAGEESELEVNIDYSTDDGRTWHPSEVFLGGCAKEAYNLAVIVSDDGVDKVFDDAVCLISWPHRGSGARS